jgi:AcrR family transcriptional regulator
MARPSNPSRKTEMLARATDYVLAHGLSQLSLRPLAVALDTSTRMLLYDFGSKEKLVADVLAEARRREAELLSDQLQKPGATQGETLLAIWKWIAAKEREPFLRLFFEVYVDALAHPEKYAGAHLMVDDWIESLRKRWPPTGLDPNTATLFIAVVRGLLLDRLAANDPRRTDEAIRRFVLLLDRQ